VEVLEKFCQGLRPLLNLGQVDAGSPLFATSNELAKKSISQVLEARDVFQHQAIEPGLRHPF